MRICPISRVCNMQWSRHLRGLPECSFHRGLLHLNLSLKKMKGYVQFSFKTRRDLTQSIGQKHISSVKSINYCFCLFHWFWDANIWMIMGEYKQNCHRHAVLQLLWVDVLVHDPPHSVKLNNFLATKQLSPL